MDLPRKNMKNQRLKQGKRCLSKLMCKGEIVIQVHFRRRIHNVKEILRRLNNNGYFWQNFQIDVIFWYIRLPTFKSEILIIKLNLK